MAEKNEHDIKNFLEDIFCPVVLVRCSEDVDKILFKNNLRLIDLLRPFERMKKEGIHLITQCSFLFLLFIFFFSPNYLVI